jgi:hypothetical protein
LGSRPSSKKSASPVRLLWEEEAAALKKNGCRNNSLPNIILIIVVIFLFYHFLQTLLPSLHRKLGFSIGRNRPERKKECKTISVSAGLLLIVCFFFFFQKLGFLHARLTHLQSSAKQDSNPILQLPSQRRHKSERIRISWSIFQQHVFLGMDFKLLSLCVCLSLSLSWEDDVSVVSVDL